MIFTLLVAPAGGVGSPETCDERLADGGRARPCGRPDGIPARLLHRSSAPGRKTARRRRAGLGDLRRPDPTRRDPGRGAALLPTAAAGGADARLGPAVAPLRPVGADRLPARGGDR